MWKLREHHLPPEAVGEFVPIPARDDERLAMVLLAPSASVGHRLQRILTVILFIAMPDVGAHGSRMTAFADEIPHPLQIKAIHF